MSTTLKEWLKHTIAELEEERDATPGAVNVDAANALAAMKLALASIEAEPVFEVEVSGNHWLNAGPVDDSDFSGMPDGVNQLYSAPPAPVSVPAGVTWEDVPEEITEDDMALASAWAHGFNQCRAAMLQGKAESVSQHPELTVWYGSMPETNGKTNWTAILHRKGESLSTGITVDCSEYPDRVRYEADRMRHLIGELADEPDILAYDADAHSGYAEPASQRDELPGWVACSERMPEQFVEVLVCTEDGGRYVAALNQRMNWDDGDFFDDIQYVTHWMPLPAAPQQEAQ